MAITLTAEQETQVREVAELRGFATVEDYLSEVLRETYEGELSLAEHRAEFSAMIDEGWAEMERGEFVTSDQMRADLEAAKREFRKRDAA